MQNKLFVRLLHVKHGHSPRPYQALYRVDANAIRPDALMGTSLYDYDWRWASAEDILSDPHYHLTFGQALRGPDKGQKILAAGPNGKNVENCMLVLPVGKYLKADLTGLLTKQLPQNYDQLVKLNLDTIHAMAKRIAGLTTERRNLTKYANVLKQKLANQRANAR